MRTFAQVLPPALRPWVPYFHTGAEAERLPAELLAAVCMRESGGGAWLRPHGPSGTGDHAPRWFTLDRVPQWADELGLRTGVTKLAEDGKVILWEVTPPAYAGAAVPGWGMGLFQIDFASHRAWLDERTWNEPGANAAKGAEILRLALAEFPGDLTAGVCRYNASAERIRRALLAGRGADAATTGGDYGSWVLQRARAWHAAVRAPGCACILCPPEPVA